jgi:hypothetical protein
MNPPTVVTLPHVPPEVAAFAARHGASEYLYPVLELACSVFPGRPVDVFLEEDYEIDELWQIVFEADVTGASEDALFAGQTRWSAEVFQRCPARYVHLFQLGLGGT